MKNILIDTCSLIDLLSEDKNKLLPHLEFWKQNNCIKFVTHKLIVEELSIPEQIEPPIPEQTEPPIPE